MLIANTMLIEHHANVNATLMQIPHKLECCVGGRSSQDPCTESCVRRWPHVDTCTIIIGSSSWSNTEEDGWSRKQCQCSAKQKVATRALSGVPYSAVVQGTSRHYLQQWDNSNHKALPRLQLLSPSLDPPLINNSLLGHSLKQALIGLDTCLQECTGIGEGNHAMQLAAISVC